MTHPLWLVSPFLLPPVLSCLLLFLLLPPLQAVLWARQPNRHESLCHSANKESEDAHDISTSLTESRAQLPDGEFIDSSVPFSFMNPSSDQDMDDVTLGKLLTEAHRGQADCCEPEGVSVSQSSSSVVVDRSGKSDVERNVDQSLVFGVTRNTCSAHSKFSENTRTEKVVDRSGKLEEQNSSNAQIWTLLEE